MTRTVTAIYPLRRNWKRDSWMKCTVWCGVTGKQTPSIILYRGRNTSTKNERDNENTATNKQVWGVKQIPINQAGCTNTVNPGFPVLAV